MSRQTHSINERQQDSHEFSLILITIYPHGRSAPHFTLQTKCVRANVTHIEFNCAHHPARVGRTLNWHRLSELAKCVFSFKCVCSVEHSGQFSRNLLEYAIISWQAAMASINSFANWWNFIIIQSGCQVFRSGKGDSAVFGTTWNRNVLNIDKLITS